MQLRIVFFAVFVLAVLRLGRSSPAEPPSKVYTKTEYMIPMRDGVHLYTAVFTPKEQAKPLPFLFMRSPYGWAGAEKVIDGQFGDNLARDGYIFVFQDIRGRYKSEGEFVMERPVRNENDPHAIDEGSDTNDTIDWLLANIPNNTGRVGIRGTSYGGWLTQIALYHPHPAIKAASEQASWGDQFLHDDFHRNGAFRLAYALDYTAMMESG